MSFGNIIKYSIALLVFIGSSMSARILIYFYVPSISHQVVLQSISRQLSLRGHEVISITTDPMKDPALTNLTEIDVSVGYEVLKIYDPSHWRRDFMTAPDLLEAFLKIFDTSIDIETKTEAVQSILRKPPEYFDLVIVESHHPIIYGLQHKFRCPMIAVSSFGGLMIPLQQMGVSAHPVLYPNLLSELATGPFSIWQKFDSLSATLGIWLKYKYVILPNADRVARSYFGEDMPDIEDLIKNTSLVLVNVSPIFSFRNPYPPNVIEYYNIHIGAGENISMITAGCPIILKYNTCRAINAIDPPSKVEIENSEPFSRYDLHGRTAGHLHENGQILFMNPS